MNNIFQQFGGYQNFQNTFNQFKQNFGQGNPQYMVQQLLDSGRMSQQQFNRISQIANMILRGQNNI